MPRVKKISGPQLVRSWTEIPHVTQHDEIDITEMEKFRSSLIDYYTGEKISVTPLAFITKAVVKALQEYPNFNCSLGPNNKVFYKKYIHIGFAVDTPHGLMVPKLRNVDQMDIKVRECVNFEVQTLLRNLDFMSVIMELQMSLYDGGRDELDKLFGVNVCLLSHGLVSGFLIGSGST